MAEHDGWCALAAGRGTTCDCGWFDRVGRAPLAPTPTPSVAVVRCWRCKHEVPEETTVCNVGIGTQCKDAKACRCRWYGPVTYATATPDWRAGYDEAEAVYHEKQTDMRRELRLARAATPTPRDPGCLPKCEPFDASGIAIVDHDYDCPNLRGTNPAADSSCPVPFSKLARYKAIIDAARSVLREAYGPSRAIRELDSALAALDADWPKDTQNGGDP